MSEQQQQSNAFLSRLVDNVVDSMLPSQTAQIVDRENQKNVQHTKQQQQQLLASKMSPQGSKQQIGHRSIEVLPDEKQNVLIRKMFLIYANSYLRGAVHWHRFAQVFHKRHGKGCIFVQFKDVENIPINGDKMVIGLSQQDSIAVNNIFLPKTIEELYDPKKQFVLCLNVNSYDEKKGWFLTCIVDKNTEKVAFVDLDDEPVIFEPSVAEKIHQSTALKSKFEKELQECVDKEQQLQTTVYTLLKGMTEFLKQNNATDLLLLEQQTTFQKSSAKQSPQEYDSDDDVEDKTIEKKSTEEAKLQKKKEEKELENSPEKEIEKIQKKKEEKVLNECFDIAKLSPFFIQEFLKNNDEKEKTVKEHIDKFILNRDKIGLLQKQVDEHQQKLKEYEPLLDDDNEKQKQIQQQNHQLLNKIEKQNLSWYTAKELQEYAINYKNDIVDRNRHFLIVLRDNLKEQRNLYNCCNDPCNKTEDALRQFDKHFCKSCKFVLYCSQECLKKDRKRHISECSSIKSFKVKNPIDVYYKKLEETAEIEYSNVE